jgi:hypothetical protein
LYSTNSFDGNEPVRSVIWATEIGRAITWAQTQQKWAPTPGAARAFLAISGRGRFSHLSKQPKTGNDIALSAALFLGPDFAAFLIDVLGW